MLKLPQNYIQTLEHRSYDKKAMFNLLRAVNQSKSDWKVRVRVTRMWTSRRDSSSSFRNKLIILDNEVRSVSEINFLAYL